MAEDPEENKQHTDVLDPGELDGLPEPGPIGGIHVKETLFFSMSFTLGVLEDSLSQLLIISMLSLL